MEVVLRTRVKSGTRIDVSQVKCPARKPAESLIRSVAVPPAPPKQFTDEELKQQYGIHMATRLQADEAGKDKWADIDDDEDDWAPEAVEWMDGTKSTGITTENQPPPIEARGEMSKSGTPEPSKSTAAAIQPPSSAPGTKTILKPGAHLTDKSRASSMSLKTDLDKSGPTTKPTGGTPSKSPWKPLPPVETVSPIAPPVQQPPTSRFAQHDPHGFDALPPMSAAQEIAADDFSRNWRDNERGTRELFNSKSGQYEPVNDARRGSVRNDAAARQPALLQRPSQQGHPAEPSAAFQTNRTSSTGEGAQWGRRRGSSNASGGSGAPARRMSFGRPSDLPPISANLEDRRDSQALSISDTTTPGGAARQGYFQQPSAPSPADPATSPEQANGVPAGPPPEDPVAMQQRMMKERIERARAEKQRRIEEEEQEQQARKERLRLKMEALAKKEEPPVEPTKDVAAEPDKPVPSNADSKPKTQSPAKTSPPKPPLPTTSGEVTQYGMMKVHQPQPVKRPAGSATQPIDLTAQEQGQSQVSPPAVSEPVRSTKPSPSATQSHPSPQQVHARPREDHDLSSSQQPADDRRQQAWKSSGAQDRLNNWGQGLQNHAQSNNRVWGAPTKNALGNGIFDSGYARLPTGETQQSATSSASPGPIGPPSSAKRSPAASHVTASASHSPQHPRVHMQPNNASATHHSGEPLTNGASVPGAPGHGPGPIGPPRAPSNQTDQYPSQAPRGDWKGLGPLVDQSSVESARARDQHERGLRHPDDLARLREGRHGGMDDVRLSGNDHIIHDGKSGRGAPGMQPSGGQLPLDQHPASMLNGAYRHTLGTNEAQQQRPIGDKMVGGAVMPANAQQQPHAAPGARASRFFPPKAEVASQQQVAPSKPEGLDDSPPPPDAGDLFGKAAPSQAKVKLPPPKAVVKLPQVAPSPPPQPVQMPMRPVQPRLGSQPIVQQIAWQDRINNLFHPGRPSQPITSPGKAQALPVASASRAPLDAVPQEHSATVSLPTSTPRKQQHYMFATNYNSDARSKAPSDVLISDEERQTGSVPTVRVPRGPYMNSHLMKYDLALPSFAPSLPPMYTVSYQGSGHLFEWTLQGPGLPVEVHLPGQAARKTQFKRRPTREYRGNISYRGRGRGGKPHTPTSRKSSSQFSPSGSQAGVPRSPSVANSSGNGRGSHHGKPRGKRTASAAQ